MIQKGELQPITEQRINAIARKIIKKCIFGTFNSENEVIKELVLDDILCVPYLLDDFKKNHNKEILLSEIEDYIEGEESVEELTDDLNITIDELKQFELHLYYKHTGKK